MELTKKNLFLMTFNLQNLASESLLGTLFISADSFSFGSFGIKDISLEQVSFAIPSNYQELDEFVLICGRLIG